MTVKLSENQVALILSYGPDRFDDVVADARTETAQDWVDDDGARAEKMEVIRETDVYELEQLGWQIVSDTDELVMATVTPVPAYADSEGEYDLEEITHQFVYEFKENAIDAVDAVREGTGLRPRLFTAAMIRRNADLIPGTDQFIEAANSMGYSEEGLEDLFAKADEKIEQAARLHNLARGTSL